MEVAAFWAGAYGLALRTSASMDSTVALLRLRCSRLMRENIHVVREEKDVRAVVVPFP